MMMPSDLEAKVAQITRVYRANYPGLVKAVGALIESEVKRRMAEDLRTVGEKVCQHKHPVGSSGVVCRDCVASERSVATQQALEDIAMDILS